jgi:hypothetical protein
VGCVWLAVIGRGRSELPIGSTRILIGRQITDQQTRLFMSLRDHGSTPRQAAAKAGFSTATAYRTVADPWPPTTGCRNSPTASDIDMPIGASVRAAFDLSIHANMKRRNFVAVPLPDIHSSVSCLRYMSVIQMIRD